jgi:mannose-6-phosphate isomerase
MPSSVTHGAPELLAATPYSKIWGSPKLLPWFPDSDVNIGEVWYQAVPPLPLLVKFIFTSAPLSVQVHPNDEYAREHANSAGKTEMWHILRADPGARIAIGLREAMSPERLRSASESGEIERLLNWVEVRPGDTFHIPAGTIHAIGAGIALCEIQQNSDITYRLYDYGRPRELHLDHAMRVSYREPWEAAAQPPGYLARCGYYAVQGVDIEAPLTYVPDNDRFHLLIVTEGSGALGQQPFRAGQVWHVRAGTGAFHINPERNTRLLRVYVP